MLEDSHMIFFLPIVTANVYILSLRCQDPGVAILILMTVKHDANEWTRTLPRPPSLWSVWLRV